MKRLLFTLIVIAFVTGCGKSDNNSNSGNTVAVTPNDCYNQGLQPGYFPNNPWNNPYNTWNYGPSYNTGYGPFNSNNVGCINNGNNYQQVYWSGQPYYYIPNQVCNLNSPYNTCPMGLRCQYQQGFYIYWGWNLARQGVCAP